MTAEAAAEAAVVERKITTPPSPPHSGLLSYRIAPTLAVECLTLYTAAALASAAVAVPILPTIRRTMMRVAGGGAPTTTMVTVMTRSGIAAAT